MGSYGNGASEACYIGRWIYGTTPTFSSNFKVHGLVMNEGGASNYLTAQYFVDGTQKGSTTNLGGDVNPRGFCLGSYFQISPTPEYCECYIAELKVWERALDSSEFAAESAALVSKYAL